MAFSYSTDICNRLKRRLRKAKLHRPIRVSRYDEGDEMVYDACMVSSGEQKRVRLAILKFVGGGFAGQVYKVKVLDIAGGSSSRGAIAAGGVYAMKILVPPSGFSRLFRNLIYWIGFQGPFQLQVNPAAARAGALWQKFIRRGARIRFDDDAAVVDIHATFVDSVFGSCGELSEWVDGRTWRLEVDDRLDWLRQWRKGRLDDESRLGSPEYRAKYAFMHEFVSLLHDMGGHEFARQYEWQTCKSQPNCLKRTSGGEDPAEGLVAVDFRAGLALLPFLPMSPGDFSLILAGLRRGSLVQFDRGSIPELEAFIARHRSEFDDMTAMLADLKRCEATYRDSVLDITHHRFRLLYSRRLWSTMLDSTVTGWQVRNLADDDRAAYLRGRPLLVLLLTLAGCLPFLGKVIRRSYGRQDWRKHYRCMVSSWDYFKKAVRSKGVEKVIDWHRDGRIDDRKALKVAGGVSSMLMHLPLSILPVGMHRMLTDRIYARERLSYLFVRPIRLYFNRNEREEWLRDMVADGQEKHILDEADARVILSQIREPFIQKYLKSLAVHVCTLPVTQVVSVIVAVIYVLLHPEMPRAQSWAIGLGIVALFQVVPISPGSLVRGLYVLMLVIRERNFRDYNIAVFLGFFKYIGYLAFPIQMAYRYPVLARFMAGYWASETVHAVPVFGESGALLELSIFRLFYNWPLTLWRRIRKRIEDRSASSSRYWHVGATAVAAAGLWCLVDSSFIRHLDILPALNQVWWLTLLLPFGCGAVVTMGGGGATIGKRFISAVICGISTGVLSGLLLAAVHSNGGVLLGDIAVSSIWRAFVFGIFTLLGAISAELLIPDPELSERTGQ